MLRRALVVVPLVVLALAPAVGSAGQADGPQPYPFYPQAGTPWKDFFYGNFVDLDPGPGIQDWNCSTYTYDGHSGHDTPIIGFGHQAIGVPVFAALDGTVVEMHDGDDDHNTEGSPETGNYVRLDHGNTHASVYFHLKKGSVSVSPGQSVTGGTQIGLVGSSGNSTWPHLHFESEFNGVVYEPSAGECRPGPSNWVDQIPIPTSPNVSDVKFSDEPWEGRSGLPWDEGSSTGTFLRGARTIYPRVYVNNIQENSRYRLQFVNPDGKKVMDQELSFENASVVTTGWFWWALAPNLDRVGRWHFVMRINGKRVLDAPFKVVARAAQVRNRHPKGVIIRVDSTGAGVTDALVCRIAKPTLIRDADYDLVSNRYLWRIGESVVRDVTSAALSDMLPRSTASPGDTVTCKVTPNDGTAAGPTTMASYPN